jgi:hypothetical protein
MPDPTSEQAKICRDHSAPPDPPDPMSKLGISRTFSSQETPINGLRHPPDKGTNGWYIWSGKELSDAHDFFVPLHTFHLEESYPEIMKYLALPPGWRFLIASDYEDIWYDESLLDV